MKGKNKTHKQHIIPKAQLDRFTDRDGKITVHRFDGPYYQKKYTLNPSRIACADYYFDEEPSAADSLEIRFKPMEDAGQNSLDCLLWRLDDEYVRNMAVRYIGMVWGRDPSFLKSLKRVRTTLAGETIDESMERGLKHEQYEMSTTSFLMHDYSDLVCFVRFVDEENRYLISGDHPYIVIDFNNPEDELELDLIFKQYPHPRLLDEESASKMRNCLFTVMDGLVIAVPISPAACLFIRSRFKPHYEEIISDSAFQDVIKLINWKIVFKSDKEVYSHKDVGWTIGYNRDIIPHIRKDDPLYKLKNAIRGNERIQLPW